jgi:hypothetical protein
VNVDAEWSATGATGYRLFYTNSATGKVEMADMGPMNQISAVMEDGTALSVYVQAYNADGDSPYSEVKSFVVSDPASGKTPEMLKPEAQSLAFQAVSLDTPVAFLPTAEDVAVQERTVRSSRSKKTYGPEFEDGRISMTVHIAPALVQRDLLELSLCLGVADTCEPLLVWNSEEQGYTETITIRDLPNDVEKSVYLELLLPKALVEKLRAQSSEEQEYVLYASDVNSVNPTAKNVQVAKIPVVNLGTTATRKTRAALKIETPQFGKAFSSSMFGVKFNITPQLWIYKTKADPAVAAKSGAQLGATGTITATVMGNTFDIMNLQGTATKNSGKRLTRKVVVNVLGKDIYTKWESKKPRVSSAATSARDSTAPSSTNWQACANDTTAQCSEPPPAADGEANSGSDGDETSPLNNIFSYTKTVQKGYSQIYVIVFVPVKAELGVSGTAELNVGAAVEITTSPIGLKVTGGGGPRASIGGYANAGVTILIASAGIEGTITLISDELMVNAIANLVMSPSFNLTFGGAVTNQLGGPSGNVGLYATYIVPAWSLPPWKTKKVTKNLVSWTTFTKTFTLLSWGSDGTQQPNDPNTALANAAASTNGDPVPIFTNIEPPAGSKGWVCVYASNVNHKFPKLDANGVPLLCNESGNPPSAGNTAESIAASQAFTNKYIGYDNQSIVSCTQIPEANAGQLPYQEVGFNISSMDKASVVHKSECPAGSPGLFYGDSWYSESWNSFVNSVTSLKIWGPLRVAMFAGENRTGSSAYWYATTGATEVTGGSVSADFMKKLSKSMLMTRIGKQDSYPNPSDVSACFYWKDDQQGESFCSNGSGNPSPMPSGAKVSNGGKNINYVGDHWNNEIASVSLSGFGTVCAYENDEFGGYQSCYQGQGGKIIFNLAYLRDKIGSIKFFPTPILALTDNLTGSLEQAGTSSLPNGYLNVSGTLDGFVSVDGSISQLYHSNSASVATVQGPATVWLKSHTDNSGNNSYFFLDAGEWDVTYLNGLNDSTVAYWYWKANCSAGSCTGFPTSP